MYTERKAMQLKKRMENTTVLRNWRENKPLNKELKRQTKELRRLKMTPTKYIKVSEERLFALN